MMKLGEQHDCRWRQQQQQQQNINNNEDKNNTNRAEFKLKDD